MSKREGKKKAVPKIKTTLDKLELDVEALAGVSGGAWVPWIVKDGKVIQKGSDNISPSAAAGYCASTDCWFHGISKSSDGHNCCGAATAAGCMTVGSCKY